MKAVIPCSSRKKPAYWMYEGQKVKFVAHPDQCGESGEFLFCRPDDRMPSSEQTWRQELVRYNRSGSNPQDFPRAAKLYEPKVYRQLAAHCGWENTFIFSAGWGLVRADFLLPTYDITFSSRAENCNRRSMDDDYDDFNHLMGGGVEPGERVIFCGGIAYLRPYYRLTRHLPGRKIIYHKAQNPPREGGYDYIKYDTDRSTNWHYDCWRDFIQGELGP